MAAVQKDGFTKKTSEKIKELIRGHDQALTDNHCEVARMKLYEVIGMIKCIADDCE